MWLWASLLASLSLWGLLNQVGDGNTLTVSPEYVLLLFYSYHVFIHSLDLEPKRVKCLNSKCGQSYVKLPLSCRMTAPSEGRQKGTGFAWCPPTPNHTFPRVGPDDGHRAATHSRTNHTRDRVTYLLMSTSASEALLRGPENTPHQSSDRAKRPRPQSWLLTVTHSLIFVNYMFSSLKWENSK